MNPMDLAELARHMEWADAAVWGAVLRSDAARADEHIRTWLYHIHVAQHAFLQIWRGDPLNFPEPSAFPDPAALVQWGRQGHHEIKAFLATMSADALVRGVLIPWADRGEGMRDKVVAQATLGQTVIQVLMHTTHHRAQISARLRDLGGEPPLTDFIGWVWFGQPAAEWPASTV